MSTKSTPFDYEPVTRRGKKATAERELGGEFAAPRGNSRADLSAGVDDDWSLPAQAAQADDDGGGEATAVKRARPAAKKEGWIAGHGHAVSFAGLFLFTLVLYFRPYELFESLSSFKSLAFWIAAATIAVFIPVQLSLEGALRGRAREVNLILLLALIGLVGVPFAIIPSEAWANFIEFLKVVLMFIVMVNVTRTEGRLKALMLLALAAGCVMSVAVLNDYRSGVLKLQGERVEGLVGGMFGNPNDLALFLVIMIPLAVGMLLATRGMVKKTVYGAGALLMVAATLITFSRGGFFGLVCVLLVLAWKLGRRNRFTVILGSLLAGGVLMALLPGGLVERLASMFGGGVNESAASSAVSRWALLIRSVWISARHPLLGIGMGNFHEVSIREQVSHNAYTQVSAEMGVAALVIYVMLMLTALGRLRQVERETFDARHKSRFYYLAVGLQASLVGYMVSSFFVSVAYLYYVYYPIGYAFCLYLLYRSSRAGEAGAAARGRAGGVEAGARLPARAMLEPGKG